MDIENKDVDLNNEGEETTTPDLQEEQSDETPAESDNSQSDNSRREETPEARKARLERQLKQLNKKHPELFEQSESRKSSQSGELDYGQKAYLVANGIKDSSEIKLAQTVMQETGKTLEQVLESKYFQAELSEMRESKATNNAIPKGKRSGNATSDTVEYWLAKGTLPPVSEVELRRKVVNARAKKSESSSIFYNQ